MLGLEPGDAKIFRNPGGRVTPQALEALVLGVHLLGVDRILVIPHTRCAMASSTEAELRERSAPPPARTRRGSPSTSSRTSSPRSRRTSPRCASHPLIPDNVQVGGFLYDVDTGLLDQQF